MCVVLSSIDSVTVAPTCGRGALDCSNPITIQAVHLPGGYQWIPNVIAAPMTLSSHSHRDSDVSVHAGMLPQNVATERSMQQLMLSCT